MKKLPQLVPGLTGLLVFLTLTCSKSKFSKPSDVQTAAPKPTIPVEPVHKAQIVGIKASSTQTKAVLISSQKGPVTFKIDDQLQVTTESKTVKNPLAIYFALDVSGSMGGIISSIKSSIVEFTILTTGKGFDAKYGIVTFNDTIEQVLPLGDARAIKEFIDKVDPFAIPKVPNNDRPEFALGSIIEAKNLLVKEENRPNAAKIVFAISDAPGHNGDQASSAGTRSCDPLLVSKELKAPELGAVKFLYSVSDASFPDYPCGKYADARKQFDEILADLKKDDAKTYVGEALSWPFSGQTLLAEMAGILSTKIQAKAETCKVDSVELSQGKKVIQNWTRAQIEGESKGVLSIDKALAEDQIKALAGQDLTLTIKRCCEASENVCSSSPLQKVSIRVEALAK